MWFKVKEMVWPELVGAAAGWLIWWRTRIRGREFRRKRKLAEEMEVYCRLNVRLGVDRDVSAVAERVCRTVATHSSFSRTAMLVRDARGGLKLAASVGMDKATVDSIEAWAAEVALRERDRGSSLQRGGEQPGVPVGAGSFAVVLGETQAGERCTRAVVVPLWPTGGRMAGALLVGADGLTWARRSALREALEPLEALAAKVARALENADVADRLMRAEKLAGLGVLAGGMAHALHAPLTAVLGFAELIAATSAETRVREDAGVIVREALKMRQTVESLLEFWRPTQQESRLVELAELVHEVAAACADELEDRGVRLVVEADGEQTVAGNRHRLRQLLEHLLNNAAQAVEVEPKGEQKTIRVKLIKAAGTVQMTVSDTGTGFREPERVFDPFGGVVGAGVGLSICYGIVHEHGGEIRAGNIAPHGAEVTVELPVASVSERERFAVKPQVLEEA